MKDQCLFLILSTLIFFLRNPDNISRIEGVLSLQGWPGSETDSSILLTTIIEKVRYYLKLCKVNSKRIW